MKIDLWPVIRAISVLPQPEEVYNTVSCFNTIPDNIIISYPITLKSSAVRL
jgi:hypothetical protein